MQALKIASVLLQDTSLNQDANGRVGKTAFPCWVSHIQGVIFLRGPEEDRLSKNSKHESLRIVSPYILQCNPS